MFLSWPGFHTFIVMQRMLSIRHWYSIGKLQAFFECFLVYSDPSKSAWLDSKYLTPFFLKKTQELEMALLAVNSRVAFLPLLFITAAVLLLPVGCCRHWIRWIVVDKVLP